MSFSLDERGQSAAQRRRKRRRSGNDWKSNWKYYRVDVASNWCGAMCAWWQGERAKTGRFGTLAHTGRQLGDEALDGGGRGVAVQA